MEQPGRAAKATIDALVAKRLWLHRRLDDLWDQANDVKFTGTVGIEFTSKDGRTGEPRVRIEHYGIPSP